MIIYDWGAELPVLELELVTNAGAVVDLSAYNAVEVRIGRPGRPALLTKTFGLTKAAIAPNLTVAWDLNDLTFTPSRYYRITIEATDGSDRDRIWQDDFVLNRVVLESA